jgi:hypothetical protein
MLIHIVIWILFNIFEEKLNMQFYFKIILLLFLQFSISQDGFKYLHQKEKIKIPFELSNNLILVPVIINDIKLHFLLDTGVDETIIFSIAEKKELLLKNTETIKLKGLGSKDFINGLVSNGNKIELHKYYKDENHKIIVVLDELFNISSSLGISINGILGSKFFNNHIIEIDYISKNIYVYKNKNILQKIEKKYTIFDLELIKGKPYIKDFNINNKQFSKKMLIDLGNSDALWLFPKTDFNIELPKKYYEDFLGRGFSGEIYGKRGKTASLEFKNFKFQSIFAAYPDSVSINNVDLIKDRIGSLGGEIMKRFSLFLNYQDLKIYLKKNSNYKNPFLYNLSGIDVHNDGIQWINEEVKTFNTDKFRNSNTVFSTQLRFQFVMKPKYIIANVRKNSTADLAGLHKDDILVSINNKKAYQLTLEKINSILKDDSNEKIELVIERYGKEMTFQFVLEDILN